uniref:Uncharacterized protein n=1 Tax=Magallana gigas TaxID=29159 RepID=K1Q842_MAGGI
MRSNLEDIRNWVEEDDVFIVDRGFRDSLTYLEELGIQVKMPSSMEKGEKQLSTDAANTSRLVTKGKNRDPRFTSSDQELRGIEVRAIESYLYNV